MTGRQSGRACDLFTKVGLYSDVTGVGAHQVKVPCTSSGFVTERTADGGTQERFSGK